MSSSVSKFQNIRQQKSQLRKKKHEKMKKRRPRPQRRSKRQRQAALLSPSDESDEEFFGTGGTEIIEAVLESEPETTEAETTEEEQIPDEILAQQRTLRKAVELRQRLRKQELAQLRQWGVRDPEPPITPLEAITFVIEISD